jgi:hypothetical protein
MIIIALSGVAGLALSITGAQASVVVPGKPSVKIPGNNTHRPAFDVRPSNTQANGIKIVYNGNWSGYVATGTKFKYVVGSYSVPSVNCSVTPSSFSYHWVGLDGASDGTVEQDGIGSFCNGSTPYYFAWAWMYPNPGELTSFTVNPGDSITSSVYYASGVYTLKLTDQTTGQKFDVTSSGAYNNSSAEAITEGYPTTGENGTADFGEEHYDTIKVTDSAGKAGGLSSSNWSTDEFIAEDSSGSVDTQPGPLYTASPPAQSAFEITWERED